MQHRAEIFQCLFRPEENLCHHILCSRPSNIIGDDESCVPDVLSCSASQLEHWAGFSGVAGGAHLPAIRQTQHLLL